MVFEVASPLGVQAAINDDGNAIYVDVRTVAEFASGRPKGRAVNIPIEFYHPKSGDTYPNEAFALVASHALDTHDTVIIGADEGARAETAAKAMAAAGFSQIQVMVGGFPVWQKAGLKVTGDNRDGVSYASLLTAARRAKPK